MPRISQSSKGFGLIVWHFVSRRSSCNFTLHPPSTWKEQRVRLSFIFTDAVSYITTGTPWQTFLSWKANVWKTTININNIFFLKKKNISKELWTWICHSLCFYRTATVFSTLFYCLSFVPLVVYYLFAPLAKVEILKCELQMRTFTATIIPVPHCSLELHAVWTCSHGRDAHWCDALPSLLPPDRYLHCMLVAPNLGQRCKAGLLPKEVSGLVTSSWYRREDWSRPLLRGCYIEWIG